MLLRKINAAFSLIVSFLVLDHAIFLSVWMLSGGGIEKTMNYMPWIMTGLTVIHALISIELGVSAHRGLPKQKVNSYSKLNAPTIIQRMSGILMLVFTAVSTIGIAPLQGDMNALIASCSEYTTLTTGHRIDGMMFSCSSLGIKIGGAFGTALCGWLLDSTGFVENTTQNAATTGMLYFLYLWAPIIICGGVFLLLSLLRVEKANDKLLAEREDKTVPDVYGNV